LQILNFDQFQSGQYELNGAIDELRISNVARSSAWIATEYANQNAPGTFIGLGAQTTSPPSVILTTSPAGLTLAADGVNCTAPCYEAWSPGTNHTIGVVTPQAGQAGVQYVYSGWSDSGAASHSITATANSTTYTAAFSTQYYLTVTANPPGGGTLSAASGWHSPGDTVPVSASTNSGYTFAGFSGALAGTVTPQNVTVNGPAQVNAFFPSTSFRLPPSREFAMSFDMEALYVTGGDTSASLTNMVMPWQIGSPSLKSLANGGAMRQPNCEDVSLWSDTQEAHNSPLMFTLSQCDTTNGVIGGYVLIPSMSTYDPSTLVLPGSIFYGTFSDASQTASPAATESAIFAAEGAGAIYTFRSGNPGADASGNNNNGTVTGCTAGSGYAGAGLDCDGASGHYLKVPDSSTLHPPANLTVAARIYLRATGGYGAAVLQKGSGGSPGAAWQIAQNYVGAGRWGASVSTSGSGQVDCYTSWIPPLNGWNNVVFTYDGAYITLYINGTMAQTPCAASGTINYSENDTSLYINEQNAIVSDVHIDPYVWSAARIAAWGGLRVNPSLVRNRAYDVSYGALNDPGQNCCNGDTNVTTSIGGVTYVTGNDGTGPNLGYPQCGASGSNIWMASWSAKYSTLRAGNCMTSFGLGNSENTGGWSDSNTWKSRGQYGTTALGGTQILWAVMRQNNSSATGHTSILRSCDGGATWIKPATSSGAADCAAAHANSNGNAPLPSETATFHTLQNCVYPNFVQYPAGTPATVDNNGSRIYAYCMNRLQTQAYLAYCDLSPATDCTQDGSWHAYTGAVGGDYLSTPGNWTALSDAGATPIFSSPSNAPGGFTTSSLSQPVYVGPPVNYLIVNAQPNNGNQLLRADQLSGPWEMIGPISPWSPAVQQVFPDIDASSITRSGGSLSLTLGYVGQYLGSHYNIVTQPISITVHAVAPHAGHRN
jgi:hypothetical protein